MQTLCDAVDGSALMRHIGTFARWEKLSGSAGEAGLIRIHEIIRPAASRSRRNEW